MTGSVCRASVLALTMAGSWSLLAQAPATDAPPAKPDPNAIVNAVAALGGASLQSIRYSGSGTMTMGGGAAPGQALPLTLRSYEVSIDYPASAMQVDLVEETGTVAQSAGAPGGTEAHHIQAVNGDVAWDLTFVAPPADDTPHKGARRKGSATTPAVSVSEPPRLNPAMSLLRRQAIWMTPHGFLKAALANQPALQAAGSGTEVSFYAGAHRYVGFLNSKHQVERVRTWVRRPDAGDVLLDTTYTDYQPFAAVSFPTRITQLENGRRVLDVTVTTVQPNVKVRVPVPAGLTVS